MRGRARVWRAVFGPAIVLALGASSGCSSCKKKQQDDLTKDEGKKKHGPPEVPMPADLAFEMVVKDPDDLVKRGADASGHGAEVGSDPYQKILDLVPDEDTKKIMRAFDPHGAVSVVVTAKASALLDVDHWSKDTVQVVAAAHIKDRDLAKTALDAASKKNGTKSGPAKGFEGRLYELEDDLAVGLSGDVVLAGDGAEALEKCGRYAVYLAEKGGQPHDMIMRVPLDALEEEVAKTAPAAWSKAKSSGDVPPSIVAELDPLVGPLVTAFGEAGDATAWFDVKGDMIVAEQSMGAKGTLAKFLSSWPSGDATAMLAMPQGDGEALYRWPDGLGPLSFAGLDYVVEDSVKRGDLTAPEGADIKKIYRAFGGALGHEVVYTSKMSAGGMMALLGSGSGGIEYLARVELSDPATAKKAIVDARAIVDAECKKPPVIVKLAVTPYKKFGAEGETIVVPGSAMGTYSPHADSTVAWAIRGSYLYVDGCLYCNAPMFDDALDPAGTKTLASDSTAKSKIGAMPSKGLIEAGYGDMGTYFKTIMVLMGVTSSSGKPAWGWGTAGSDGLRAHEEVPVGVIADLVQIYTRSLGMFGGGYGGYPMPMGTPTPPPPPPAPKPPF